jgi:hypothetical protein
MFRQNGPAHPPGMSSSRGLSCSGGNPTRDLAHDRNDLLHDITAGAAVETMAELYVVVHRFEGIEGVEWLLQSGSGIFDAMGRETERVILAIEAESRRIGLIP